MTLHDAAEALGVHYMTAYRYVRLGLLDAHKQGGTWQVSESALDAFRATSERGATPEGRRHAPWAARFETRLLAGDARGARGVIDAALSAATELDDVYLGIIAPAMASIGERWERGEVDVAVEHRAAGIVLRILGQLGPRFARRGRSRGAVVLGAPAGEGHFLPLAIVADLLRGAGWEVADLGADVPPDSFARVAADVQRLVAIGVGVATAEHLSSAEVTIATLRETLGDGIPILVGGGAVDDEAHAVRLGADGWAPDARALIDVLERIAGGEWPLQGGTVEAI
jgi:MerR family transcriptional regulator, light-induced transcriptional regulator